MCVADSSEEEDLMELSELALLFCIHYWTEPPFTRVIVPREERRISELTDQTCWEDFRFRKPHLSELLTAFDLPEYISTRSRYTFHREECLLILLFRLSFPKRYSDMERVFGRHRSHICEAFLFMIRHVLNRFGDILFDLTRWKPYVKESVQAVWAKGIPESLYGVWCFYDGTVRACCRPRGHGNIQEDVYDGHYRIHGIEFIGVTLPSGMFGYLGKATAARHNDCFLVNDSDLAEQLSTVHSQFDEPLRSQLAAFGDSIFAVRPGMKRMHKGNFLTPAQIAENTAMTRQRISVEWNFGSVTQQWAYLDYVPGLKLFLSPIGDIYRCAVLLTNMRSTFYGNNACAYYNITPPDLLTYLGLHHG